MVVAIHITHNGNTAIIWLPVAELRTNTSLWSYKLRIVCIAVHNKGVIRYIAEVVSRLWAIYKLHLLASIEGNNNLCRRTTKNTTKFCVVSNNTIVNLNSRLYLWLTT